MTSHAPFANLDHLADDWESSRVTQIADWYYAKEILVLSIVEGHPVGDACNKAQGCCKRGWALFRSTEAYHGSVYELLAIYRAEIALRVLASRWRLEDLKNSRMRSTFRLAAISG
jgi:hypothetical protein